MHSHGLLNYIYAGLQGKFAALNILLQCQHPSTSPPALEEVQQHINRVREWVTELHRGESIVSQRWDKPETFDAMRIVELLRALKREYAEISHSVLSLLQSTDLPQRPHDVQWLVSTYARYAYSRDNYIRGFIEFGRETKRPQMVEQYEALLPSSSDEVSVAHAFFEAAKQPRTWNQEFFDALYFQSLHIPYIYRTYVHDIAQMLSQFEGGFSFQSAGFSAPEIQSWSAAGFGPVPAGYWRAYDFSPEQAVEWQRYGVSDPAFAADWRRNGFSPGAAVPWLQFGFFPAPARKWADANFEADRAARLIEKGYQDPSQVP